MRQCTHDIASMLTDLNIPQVKDSRDSNGRRAVAPLNLEIGHCSAPLHAYLCKWSLSRHDYYLVKNPRRHAPEHQSAASVTGPHSYVLGDCEPPAGRVFLPATEAALSAGLELRLKSYCTCNSRSIFGQPRSGAGSARKPSSLCQPRSAAHPLMISDYSFSFITQLFFAAV